MGLTEKRAVSAFKEGQYKILEKKIFEVAGKDIEIEINWDSLAVNGMSHLYNEAFEKVYFSPLIMALEKICVDDFGKEAIAANLDKIIIENVGDNHNPAKWASFENKILKLDHKPTYNIGDVEDRASNLQKILENSL